MEFGLDYGVIDAHVHIGPLRMMKPHALELMRRRRADAARIEAAMYDAGALLRLMDEEGIERLAAINYVSPEIIGFTEEVNRYAIDLARRTGGRVLACGGIDPRGSNDPAGDTARIIEQGIRLIKIHPPHQLLYPNAYLTDAPGLADVYRTAAQAGIPIMFHTGTSVFPGARNRYGQPILLDDVAVDFPELKIIMAHGGRPLWMAEAVFLLRRHPNVFLDVSSIPPSSLLQYFPRLEELAAKSMFGSDWPGPGVPGMSQNVAAFLNLALSDAAKRRILRATALQVLWQEPDS